MSQREHATEIDQLLPSTEDRRPPKHSRNYYQNRHRLTLAVGISAILALSTIFYVLSKPATHKYHKTRERSYKPSKQLRYLNDLTKSTLGKVLINSLDFKSISDKSAPNGLLDTTQLASDPANNNLHTFQCSSQLMIMRHCDKDVQVKDKHGRIRTRDRRDIFGDGHCSSKGKERSAYIATLFLDNEEFQGLVNGTTEIVDDLSNKGVPPIPAVNATDASVSVDAIKPQFPTPLKIYALNDARYNKNPSKEHQNFREVETVTPLADKFHLSVNESFGVNQEGELAADFFTSLSQSVKLNIDKALGNADPTADGKSNSEDDSSILHLCQNGMTVVNWKHSLIPNLAKALGCGKDQGCPKKYHGSDFDTVWVITYKYSLQFQQLPTVETKTPKDGAAVDVEALSNKKSTKASKEKHRQLKSTSAAGNEISWEISAQTVQEGFDQIY